MPFEEFMAKKEDNDFKQEQIEYTQTSEDTGFLPPPTNQKPSETRTQEEYLNSEDLISLRGFS